MNSKYIWEGYYTHLSVSQSVTQYNVLKGSSYPPQHIGKRDQTILLDI